MKFDPPADPYGNEKNCRICDAPMEYDDWTKEWYCPKADLHPERKDRKMDYTRAEILEAEKERVEAEIEHARKYRAYLQSRAEETDYNEGIIRQMNLVDRWIDELLTKKDNLSLSVPNGWIDYDVTPTPKEMPDIDMNKIDEIPF